MMAMCLGKRMLAATVSLLAIGVVADGHARESQPDAAPSQTEQAEQTDTADSGSTVFGDIVVTAQRREERLQDVPVAISAFSGDAIEKLGFSNVLDVATQTPGFQVGGLGGSNKDRKSTRLNSSH